MGMGSAADRQAIWSDIIDYVDPVRPSSSCDYALIFGTRHGVDQFVAEILMSYRVGEFKRAILSGGATRGDPTPEAHILAEELVAAGLPEDSLIIEDRATNTLENVLFSRALLEAEGRHPDRLLLIGKICSTRRYMMTIAQQWPAIRRMESRAINYFEIDRADWYRDETFRQRVFGELERIARYQAKGDIREIDL